MKKPWLLMFIAALAGLGGGWALNQHRYGGTSVFGPLRSDNSVSIESLVSEANAFQPTNSRPVAVVTGSDTHDFGLMSGGQSGSHQFTIANEGNAPLQLTLGASTCNCTIGELEQSTVGASQQTTVTLRWTIENKVGQFGQSAQVLTNDPQHPALTFQITGRVIDDFEIVPPTWSFGEVAADESFAMSGTIYCFTDRDMRPVETKFSDDQLSDLAEFSIDAFRPTNEQDGIYGTARQAFRLTARLRPGLRQAAISQQLVVSFQWEHPAEDAPAESRPPTIPGVATSPLRVTIPVTGRVVGPLSMILNSRLTERSDGYLYDFGRIRRNDPLTAKTFVVLKGSERENTNLRIGEVSPDDVIRATLGEPKVSGLSKLFPLEFKLLAGAESVERIGASKDDYGIVWIESDNPKVPGMKVALKFALDGR